MKTEMKPLGNIYEIVGNPEGCEGYTTVKVVLSRDREEKLVPFYQIEGEYGVKVFPLDHQYFGRQIGFDATQTYLYQKAKSQFIDAISLLECAERLKAYYAVRNGINSDLRPLALEQTFAKFDKDLQANLERAQEGLAHIESQSWGGKVNRDK